MSETIALPLPVCVLSKELRAAQIFARPRQRQGALTRHVATADELRAACRTLRDRAEPSDGNPETLLHCIALLANVSDKSARRISFGGMPTADDEPIHIDGHTGIMWTDLSRVVLQAAAEPQAMDFVMRSSPWLPKPLPMWLHKAILDRCVLIGGCSRLRDIFPTTLKPRTSVEGPALGLMRATAPRLKNGMAHLLQKQGEDPLVVALALNQLSLVPRGRLFYVAVEPDEITLACCRLYEAVGWGAPVMMASATNVLVGSRVVPSNEAIVRAWEALNQSCESRRPPRHCGLDRALEHHNAFARATGWMLSFLVGARESKQLGFLASSCRPGAMYVAFQDKRTGPFSIQRPAMLCTSAQLQVRLYYSHLGALVARAARLDVREPWLRFAQDILAGKTVPLLFCIEEGRAIPLGTSDVMQGLPNELGLVPNFGRHYWQTALHAEGVRSDVIDFFARHAARGTESMTSTTLMPLVTAHRLVDDVQAQVLKRLGIHPFAGQGRRSAVA